MIPGGQVALSPCSKSEEAIYDISEGISSNRNRVVELTIKCQDEMSKKKKKTLYSSLSCMSMYLNWCQEVPPSLTVGIPMSVKSSKLHRCAHGTAILMYTICH